MSLIAHSVTIRDKSFTEIAPIPNAALISINYTVIDNSPGDFEVTVPASSHAAQALQEDGAGIVVRVFDPSTGRPDYVVISGDVETYEIGEGEDGLAVFSGFGDTQLLADSLAYPGLGDVGTGGVGTKLPDANDTFKGTAEEAIIRLVSRNIGPDANARRKYSWLRVPQPVGIGEQAAITVAPRFSKLLDECKSAATLGKLSFRMVQAGPGEVALEIWSPIHREQAQFDVETGTLDNASLKSKNPTATDVIVGGGGEGSERIFTRVESAAAARYHHRIEVFKDQRQTADLAEMAQAGQKEVEDGKAKLGASMTLGLAPGIVYGRDIKVGDTVNARIRGVDITDVVYSIKVTDDGTIKVEPSVGMQQQDADTTRAAERIRLSNLERI